MSSRIQVNFEPFLAFTLLLPQKNKNKKKKQDSSGKKLQTTFTTANNGIINWVDVSRVRSILYPDWPPQFSGVGNGLATGLA